MVKARPELSDKIKHTQSLTSQMTFHYATFRQKEFFFNHLYKYLTPEENERCSELCRKPKTHIRNCHKRTVSPVRSSTAQWPHNTNVFL